MTYFETKTRTDGTEFTCLDDNGPEWVRDTLFAIHCEGAHSPLDWLYLSASNAFDYYAMCQDNDASEDVCDQAHAFAEDHTEIYTNMLLAWLTDFSSEFDEHVEELGYGSDLAATIMAAQHGVLTEIYRLVAYAIENNTRQGDEA
jgi:hypothetical protein